MIPYTKTGVEEFLINKYGSKILKYKGFRIIRDLIYDNSDCLAGNLLKEYDRLAEIYDTNWQSIDREVRYLKQILKEEDQNTAFINKNIIEFRSTLQEDKS